MRLTSARDPEQPLQAHYVIDPQHAGHAQVMRKRGAQILVSLGPERLGPWRWEAPRLALSEETIGRRSDRHIGRVHVVTAPDVVTAGVDAHGQVEGEYLPAL